MNLSRPFITRPIATTLLTLGLALAGLAAYFVLPVARLPNVNQISLKEVTLLCEKKSSFARK